jgi:high-affinity iron transporter
LRKKTAVVTLPAILCAFCLLTGPQAFADAGPWEAAEREMRLVLSEAFYRFVAGDTGAAKDYVNRAWKEHYTRVFENEVKSQISPARAENINEWFVYVIEELDKNKSQTEMRKDFNDLNHLLSVTARRLDGYEEPTASKRNWTKTAQEMAAVLDRAYETYRTGDTANAKATVDYAYYSYYEKLGFEKTVMAYISGTRASQVEYQFSAIKKTMTNKASTEEVRETLDTLSKYLLEDADQLDGKSENAVAVFLGSLFIILRDGFEAILIVSAIIAYLIKSGNKKKTKAVYIGSLIALGASVVMAFAFNALAGATENRELVEGITVLFAVAVLFYVSNWMMGKAEASAWTGYIEGKVQSSVAKGSLFSLAFAAFLAVFREGAELILFYWALLVDTQTYVSMVWAGLGVGCAVLVVIYILIRFMSIRLPLKPFFMGTSVVLSIMAVSFIGTGVKNLQTANVVGVTPISGIASFDLLGIYPTVETLIPQGVLFAVLVVTFTLQIRKWKEGKA